MAFGTTMCNYLGFSVLSRILLAQNEEIMERKQVAMNAMASQASVMASQMAFIQALLLADGICNVPLPTGQGFEPLPGTLRMISLVAPQAERGTLLSN
jgi:hypothetical protein